MLPKLSVLTLGFYPYPGGVEQYLFEIVQRLAIAYEAVVITPVGGRLPEGVGFTRTIIGSRSTFSFLDALKANRPDRVILGHAHPRLLAAARLYGSPYSAVIHGNDFLAAQHRWHRPFFNHLLAKSRPLIANSNATAKLAAAIGLPEPIVIHPGVDVERFRPGKKERSGKIVLLTVCRLIPRKGIDTVLGALPRVLAKTSNLEYLIVGAGPDRPRLEGLAFHLGISQIVSFLGPIPDYDLPEVYRSADLFVMPVRQEGPDVEGFGLVFLEASASGLPVIAGRSGGASEAVRDGETGILVEPGNSEALAEAIFELVQDAGKRERLSQAGRRLAETEMSWDQAARKFAQAFQDN
jgi:phosphatidylinositol alpha-1,6-mannosyltransferase